jgi:hypothetical protein
MLNDMAGDDNHEITLIMPPSWQQLLSRLSASARPRVDEFSIVPEFRRG